jgi:hypothetical protein
MFLGFFCQSLGGCVARKRQWTQWTTALIRNTDFGMAQTDLLGQTKPHAWNIC